jgi:mannosyltransferase OCH1-like enzyme
MKKFHYRLWSIPREQWSSQAFVQKTLCVPMSKILKVAKVKHINLFILDVEGGELSVLRSIDWDALVVDVFIIETEKQFRPDGFRENITSFMQSKGYIFLYEKGRNCWFRHPTFTPSAQAVNVSTKEVMYTPSCVTENIHLDKSSSCMARMFELPVVDSSNAIAAIQTTPRIPKSVWLGFDKDFNLIENLNQNKEKNPLWTFNVFNSQMRLEFMEKFYNNTSTLVAYNLINPSIRAAHVDIWRLAVLYIYGGVYIDSDVLLGTPLDNFIYDNDTHIFSQERNEFYNFYHEDYHMSNASKLLNFPLIGQLVQWMIIAEPRSPIILKALSNLVELVKLEYFNCSPLRASVRQHTDMLMFLTTGPLSFTSSVREYLLENPNTKYRTLPKVKFSEVNVLHAQKRSYKHLIKSGAHLLTTISCN